MTKLTKIGYGLLGLIIISCSPSESTETIKQKRRTLELDTIAEYNALNANIEDFDGFETIEGGMPEYDTTQIHDYSSKWDIDNDGKLDKVYLIGNGGAHLFYYLKLILSSDGIERKFSYLLIDHPECGSADDLINIKDSTVYLPQFVVDDFDKDGADEIFLNIDEYTYHVVKEDLSKQGVQSNLVLVDYENGNISLKNFN